MNNELQKISGIQPSVVQNAERSIYIENRDGGTVHLHCNNPRTDVTAEMMMAIQSFSKDYYQLIVTSQDIFTSNSIVVTTECALSKGIVPPELLRTHSVLTDDAIKRMRLLPAIICNANTDYYGRTDSNQQVLYAYIKGIRKCGKEIMIYFQTISSFSQRTLNACAMHFGINVECAKTDLNKFLWYIKKINLFEAFHEAHVEPFPSYLK